MKEVSAGADPFKFTGKIKELTFLRKQKITDVD